MAEKEKPEYEPGSFGEQNANANKGIHEAGSFGEQNREANFPAPIVPAIDPVANALEQMRAMEKTLSPLEPARDGPNREAEFDRRIKQLEDLLHGVVSSLNSASIEAVCNGDGTITITLTLPSLPG